MAENNSKQDGKNSQDRRRFLKTMGRGLVHVAVIAAGLRGKDALAGGVTGRPPNQPNCTGGGTASDTQCGSASPTWNGGFITL